MSTGRLAGLVALYTGLRFVAFVGCYGLLLLAGLRGVFAIAAALLLSSLLGLFLLRDGFKGRSHTWWMVALYIQVWHHFEHALLQGQILLHQNLFGAPVPTSIMQLAFQRVELHLFYNTIVFIPMVAAMYFHKFPPEGEDAHHNCTCAYRPQPTATQAQA